MWKLLEQAAKTATANASEYVSTVQEKAQSLVATVQDEAATLLHAIGTARTGPVDELLYEEMDDYKVFSETFSIDSLTDEISQILEQDDEIRGLHEQMVPVQLSYEEFWSRYFFRREQEELRQQREEERKKKQREQAEAKAAAKAALEEFEVDDEDDEEFDAASARRQRNADDANDDVDDAPERKLVDQADGDEAEATLAQLREIRASRKAAQQWKQKALEYQKQLGVLAAKHEDENEKVKSSMESQYQSLCDTYETKMAEVTTQIDDARAVGYQEGIEESEAIVSTMRQESENEINRLKREIAQLRQRDPSAASIADVDVSLAEMERLMEALTLKEQVVAALEESKTQLEQTLAEKESALQQALASSSNNGQESSLVQENAELKKALAALQAQLAQATTSAPTPSASEVEEVKKEMELWKIRAIKMKKAKEQVEVELQQLKELPQPQEPAAVSNPNELAALQLKLTEVERQNETLTSEFTVKLELVSKTEFERGAASVSAQLEKEIEQLRSEVAQATERGEAAAAANYKNETELLRSELEVLRADRQAMGALRRGSDVLAQADAVLSSLSSPTSGLEDADLLGETWTTEGDAAPAATGAAPPDWGEW